MGRIYIPVFNIAFEVAQREINLGFLSFLPLEPGQNAFHIEGMPVQIVSDDLFGLPTDVSTIGAIVSLEGSNSNEKKIRGQENRYLLRKIIAILRLFSDGMPYGNVIFASLGDQIEISKLPHFVAYGGDSRSRFSGNAIINQANLNDLCIHFNVFSELGADNFAVSRFSLADFEPYDTGMFLNYIMALEFLFVPDEGSIKKKLSNRIAIFFGERQSAEQRLAICNMIKQAYELRSNIVHGNELPTSRDGSHAISVEDLIVELRAYCRQGIKYCHEQELLEDYERRASFMKDIFDVPSRVFTPRNPCE